MTASKASRAVTARWITSTPDYLESDMVKLDMLVNSEPVDAFSCIVHRDKAEGRGRALAAKLKEVIPRQQYQVKIQAAIGGKIVASRNRQRLPQGRDGEMLRRRHLAQTQAAGETEGRQKAHEIHRQREHPAGSVHRGVEGVENSAAARRFQAGQRIQPQFQCLLWNRRD